MRKTTRTAAEVGEALRALRRSQGLTQAELAGVADVSRRFVSSLERGDPPRQVASFLGLLRMLGVDLDLCDEEPLEASRDGE
jgi:transcriptional regulator with XRE-family HTH domain